MNRHGVSLFDFSLTLPVAAAAAKLLQSCPTLCEPTDGSPPGFPSLDSPGKNTEVGCHFLLQCMKVKSESDVAQSCPTLATPWTAAYQLYQLFQLVVAYSFHIPYQDLLS